MAKATATPISPTVAAVFSDFLTRLRADKNPEKAIIERLHQTLTEQKFDPDSLRAALFNPVEPSKL